MPKTNPIGVRFDKELLETLKSSGLALSPQRALNLFEKAYVGSINPESNDKNITDNNEKVLAEINKLKTPFESEIGKMIEEVKKEKIPDHITTLLGKKVWAYDQKKRIDKLLNKTQ